MKRYYRIETITEHHSKRFGYSISHQERLVYVETPAEENALKDWVAEWGFKCEKVASGKLPKADAYDLYWARYFSGPAIDDKGAEWFGQLYTSIKDCCLRAESEVNQ